MKLKFLIFLTVILTLTVGCSSVSDAMSSWLGSNKKELIASWGPPSRTVSDGGDGSILIYAKHSYVPQYNINHYSYRMFYCDANGRIYRWRTSVEKVPPTQIDVRIIQ